jgi:cation diffusion facilitator family transporter
MAITDGTVGNNPRLLGVELRWAKISLAIGIALLVIKLAAYFLTGSQAILSDALENTANVVTAAFAVYAIRLSYRPADADHPYGHGKIEFVSAGLEGATIILAGLLIAGKVVSSFISGQSPQVHQLDLGLALVSFALLVNGVLGAALWYRGKKNGAIVLEAGGIHLITDAVDSVAVLIAIALVKLTGWQWIDPVAALAVAAYIAFLGVGLLKRSASGLMDEQDPADREFLAKMLDAHVGPAAKEPRICSYHKLRFRHTGRDHWVDFHIMVPKHLSIEQGHAIASAIEHEIEVALGQANATAHVEPCADLKCPVCQKSLG